MLVQFMYLHNAILNTVARSVESDDKCECTPDPGYFVGRKAFWCQEDYYIFPEIVLANLESSGAVVETDNVVIEYLKKNRSRRRIAISELYDIEQPKEQFMKRVEAQGRRFDKINLLASSKSNSMIQSVVDEEEGCIEGDDLGCCGNYGGCCWYSSIYCLIHDFECLCCTPSWYCLFGCKKEPGCNPS